MRHICKIQTALGVLAAMALDARTAVVTTAGIYVTDGADPEPQEIEAFDGPTQVHTSAVSSDGSVLVTPTGSSLGTLDPARIARLDSSFRHVDGERPTKEVPLHSAFYETRGAQTRAVVHLHSTHSVASA